MTISQRGTATTGTQPNGTSVSANKPTGVKNGDVLIAALVSNDQLATAPSGWTKFEDDATGTFRSQLYYKVAGGFEPSSYSFSVGSAAPLVLAVSAWSGVDNAVPLGGGTQLGSSGDASEPVTTPQLASAAATDGRALYFRASRRSDSAPGSPLTFSSSKDEVAEAGVYSGGSVSYSVGVFADSADFEGAGTKNGAEITASGTETHNISATVLLNAAPPAAGPDLSGLPIQDPAIWNPTGVFYLNVTLDPQTDTIIEDPNYPPNSDRYVVYRLVSFPSGKGLAYTQRLRVLSPRTNSYSGELEDLQDAIDRDGGFNPAVDPYHFNQDGFVDGVYVSAHTSVVDGNGDPVFSGGLVHQRSYVTIDLP